MKAGPSGVCGCGGPFLSICSAAGVTGGHGAFPVCSDGDDDVDCDVFGEVLAR